MLFNFFLVNCNAAENWQTNIQNSVILILENLQFFFIQVSFYMSIIYILSLILFIIDLTFIGFLNFYFFKKVKQFFFSYLKKQFYFNNKLQLQQIGVRTINSSKQSKLTGISIFIILERTTEDNIFPGFYKGDLLSKDIEKLFLKYFFNTTLKSNLFKEIKFCQTNGNKLKYLYLHIYLFFNENNLVYNEKTFFLANSISNTLLKLNLNNSIQLTFFKNKNLLFNLVESELNIFSEVEVSQNPFIDHRIYQFPTETTRCHTYNPLDF